jgi:hypothetical protein
MEFRQSGHLNPALRDPAAREANAEKLSGRWVNTNRETRGVAEIVVAQEDGRFAVRVKGVGEGGLVEWPRCEPRVLANLEEEAGQRAVALACDFDFPFMRAATHLRVNKGVLVIVLFVTFRDGSGRADYVNREFFHRAEG